MARLALGEGRDVVVPQFLARPAFIGELEALAGELGAEFVEVVLVEAPDVAAARLAQRAAGPLTAVQRDAHLLLDRHGGLDVVPELHRGAAGRARRPPRRAPRRAGARRRGADLPHALVLRRRRLVRWATVGERPEGKGWTVPVFMIERRYAEQFESSAEGADGINRINDEEGVRWLYSFLSADRRKTYCLYEAPSPDAIRRAAARARGAGRRRSSRWPNASCPTGPASGSERAVTALHKGSREPRTGCELARDQLAACEPTDGGLSQFVLGRVAGGLRSGSRCRSS